MKKQAIHQFAPSAHKGDGITNGMFYLRKILRELGFVSDIYAENFEKELRGEVRYYTEINKKDSNQILVIHYSIYYDFESWIDALPCRKIMIYHNITPYTFFQEGTLLYEMCKKGIEYLPKLASKVDAAIGDSKLNTEELLQNGFSDAKVIPVLMDLESIESARWNKKLFDKNVSTFNIIFVGRIARNKAQHDLIEVANVYKDMGDDFRMYIIGGESDPAYKIELQNRIQEYGLEENVFLTGKVSNEDLYAYYRSANLFLCMSEHEGFGIPLIESMLFHLPVMAYNSSNIKSTLNKGGILFDEKEPKQIASLIEILRQNPAFRTEILRTQKKAIQIYRHDNIVAKLVSFLNDFGVTCTYKPKKRQKQPLFQFEGPFDSSYSLAMLNRHSALAFEKKYPLEVALYSTEGYGDFEPNERFLKEHPSIKKMYEKSQKALPCKVVFRNLYPPRVTGMKGEINLLNAYGWEESAFPRKYVQSFNENLNGITVMSEYVKKVLINNGVRVPIAVVGLGAEHILDVTPKPMRLSTSKRFKFLHISSCFPRKGVDVLLEAYSEAFSIEDDVTLIIKTFPNPHNDIASQIERLQAQNPQAPEIILINEDLQDEHIAWLYKTCDALVAPSRGEGFGLPMAEAMLFNLPVITTAYGGQSDFCTQESAWLIDYSFQRAKTHMNLFDSYWVEPDKEDLKRLLVEQTTLTKEQKEQKTNFAHSLIAKEFTWKRYQERSEAFIGYLDDLAVFDLNMKKLAWISSYNTKCGIATYSDFLLLHFDLERIAVTKFANYADEIVEESKEEGVVRCWGDRFDQNNDLLIENIVKGGFTHALLNFNFGFFSMKNLQKIIDELSKNGIELTIIFHSVADVTIKGLEASLSWIKESLKKPKHLLVHNIEDLNFLKKLDLNNIDLFPHGVQNRIERVQPKNASLRTLSSYGFLLPHKGILELIEAFALLHKKFSYLRLELVNALYPAPESKNYYELCKQKVQELGLGEKVVFHTEFLSDEESFALLDASDLIVMPYRKTNESASGAIRYAVSTLLPVLCTKEPIFNDVADIVHFMEDSTPQGIANAIERLIHDKELLYTHTQKQKEWIEEHDWKLLSQRLSNILFYSHLNPEF